VLGGLQIGGGINDENAVEWLDAGASKVRKACPTTEPKLIITRDLQGHCHIVLVSGRGTVARSPQEIIYSCRKR
jgi:hypothetical protein